MTTYPYTVKAGALKEALNKIVETNVPIKFTIKHLQALGFKSPNDRSFIPVLKFIGFLDGEGIPQQPYKNYRNKANSKIVLAKAIKTGYGELFAMYEDADRKDNETLRNFFSTKTNVGEKALQSMVLTFKGLCELADFSGNANGIDDVVSASPASAVPLPLPLPKLPQQTTAGNPSVNINIELHLPPTTDAEVYNKLFEAMKKHLFEK